MTKPEAERSAVLVAGVVIVVLTAAAFWLSYAHLADVARHNGLAITTARRWAWPATLDLFIVAGEVLMFLAALRGRTDWWAVGLTVAGSLGSIGLNVAGVGSHQAPLRYVVAAIPPSAALLAFGALMRQVHGLVAPTAEQHEDHPARSPNRPSRSRWNASRTRCRNSPHPPRPRPLLPNRSPRTSPPPPRLRLRAFARHSRLLPAALVDHARKVADDHHTRTGNRIDSDTLRARLGVPPLLAEAMTAQLT